MGEKIFINNEWKFARNFDISMTTGDYDDSSFEQVRIPHTVQEVPYHYIDEKVYQMISCYRKVLNPEDSWKGKKIFVTFEGVAHKCIIYVNGNPVGKHKCGYTAFTVDITEQIKFGVDNVIAVKVDSNENLNIPPFGSVIDYLTYGGIYRDVYLEIKDNTYISDVFAGDLISSRYKEDGTRKAVVSSDIFISGLDTDKLEVAKIRQSICPKGKNEYKVIGMEDIDDSNVVLGHCTSSGDVELHTEFDAGHIKLWDLDTPYLYDIKTDIIIGDDIVDSYVVTHGFRRAVFKADGFYLNGKKVLIRGLNRHQSYPYVGYAMPASMQRYDADILKRELGVNAVRTSHYPQSQYFVNRCDELGIMVFTEIPGWQHIGDDKWKKQAVKNVKEMIVQYRNHPSVILWGVRINESSDDDELYQKTVAVAKKYDHTRQTGGVRNIKKSKLWEDVYTYNDFIHDGIMQGCDRKENVTSQMDKPYLVTEYNGHMFPTKPFDSEKHLVEHAIRHANVLDAVAGEKNIAGSFGWCMFDYNTHKEFGSGDRICYHGVMDMFRNPKTAAVVYSCQQEEIPVLEVCSSMNIGEYPACIVDKILICTNADSVKVYNSGELVREIKSSETPWKNMIHGPLLVDAQDIGFTGEWGKEVTEFRFDAIKDGVVVASSLKRMSSNQGINILVSHIRLEDKDSYDVAAVRMEAVDEYGNRLRYFNEPIMLKATGGVDIIGPAIISLKGGIGGTYVKTNRSSNEGMLIICAEQIGNAQISFTIEY